jgi:hypothetical protein
MGAMALASVAITACLREASDAEPYDVPVPGSYQLYRASTGGLAPFDYRIQVIETSPAGFTRRATIPDRSGWLESTYVVRDGTELVSRVTGYAADGSVASITTYDPPFPRLPADGTPGHTTTVTSTVTKDGISSQSTCSVTVDGIETVSVPAGVFAALRTTARTTSSQAGEWYEVVWWARGIGRVKMLDYPVANPATGTTYELTGHGVETIP